MIAFVAEDAAWFGCEAEVAHARRIARDGTSANRQLAVYDRAVAAGDSAERALKAVVDHLIAETVAGCEAAPRVVPAAGDLGQAEASAPPKVGL